MKKKKHQKSSKILIKMGKKWKKLMNGQEKPLRPIITKKKSWKIGKNWLELWKQKTLKIIRILKNLIMIGENGLEIWNKSFKIIDSNVKICQKWVKKYNKSMKNENCWRINENLSTS